MRWPDEAASDFDANIYMVRGNGYPVSHTDSGIQTSTDSGVAPDSATSPHSLADKVCRT